MSTPHPSLEPALAGSYRIDRELGRGGMAVVYLAWDVKHGRPVALKVIRPDLFFPGIAERFSREIRLAARLQHPHILPVFDSGEVRVADPDGKESPGILWYTMPYVEGESLRDRLDREQQLPVAEAIRIAREAAQALTYAHEHGIIHRDVKPENLLLSGDGSVLVADFGIARAIGGTGPALGGSPPGASATVGTQLTETGMAVGTPAYMAPDVRLGAAADARSDIYSLAAVLYEMLTGQLAAPGGGIDLERLVHADGPLVRAARPDVSEELDTVVRQGMHPVAERRFGTMAEFARALTSGAAATVVPARSRRRRAVSIGIAAVVVILGIVAGYVWTRRPPPTAGGTVAASLAILPFRNIGGDTAETYFAEGMADELTSTLVQSSTIRVASQNGIARLAPEQLTPQQVGRELGVGAMLEGTVRRQGNRLRVTARLTRTTDGVVLWANRYDRDLSDVFQVQDEMTSAIVTSIQGALTGATAVSRGTADLVAYDLYLRGRYNWWRRGREGLTKSIEYFRQAVARDSNFARAYAGIAMDYVLLPVFTDVPSDSAMAEAESNAARALALDSSLAEAHLALAYALKNEWKFTESEREFRAALALAPNDAGTRHWYGVFLYTMGRIRESLDQMEAAHLLDPFSVTILVDRAVALHGAHRFADARASAQSALSLDSTRSDACLVLGWAYLAERKADSAITFFERARQFGTGFDLRPYLSVAHREMGRVPEADRLAELIRREFAGGRSDGFSMALIATAAGDRPLAFAALERTFARRPVLLTEFSVPCEPMLDPVRSDPRFVALLRTVGMRTCDLAS